MIFNGKFFILFSFPISILTTVDISLVLMENNYRYQSNCQSSLNREPMFKLFDFNVLCAHCILWLASPYIFQMCIRIDIFLC